MEELDARPKRGPLMLLTLLFAGGALWLSAPALGGSDNASKKAKTPAVKTQKSDGVNTSTRQHDGRECPFSHNASMGSDL
jgi:hypothetical protein